MAARGATWNRASFSEQTKSALLAACAKRARLMEPSELRSRLPEMDRRVLSYLRCERPDFFGWERLLYIASQLGIDVDIIVNGKAA